MSYGIRIYNESAEKLIDSDYEMMHLHSQQDFSTSESRMTQTLSFDGINNHPVIMASVIDGQGASVSCRFWKTDSLWDRVDVRVASGILSKTIRIWIFTRGEGGGSETYGIRVYKSDGALAFDASRKMVRLHASFSGTVAAEGTNIHDFGLLDYAPPMVLNRRHIALWAGLPFPPQPSLHYWFVQVLVWNLVKDANNNFYRVSVSLTDIGIGQGPWFVGNRLGSADYSGFIFKYQ